MRLRFGGFLFLLGWFMTGMAGFAADNPSEIHQQDWSFSGFFGTFDRGSLQRGFQVYKQVCATCHGLEFIRFRELAALGFNPQEIKAIAASYGIQDGPNDEGELFERPGRPSDAFPKPYKNEKAARAANNGAYPPDLSLMIKARPDGANYVYALLKGYQDPPPGFTLGEGMYYNAIYPGHQIAMAPPLSDGLVTFSDGAPSTVAQMAWDVTNFLAWTAEPESESRRQMGVRVLFFLLIFTGILWAMMQRVWRQIKK